MIIVSLAQLPTKGRQQPKTCAGRLPNANVLDTDNPYRCSNNRCGCAFCSYSAQHGTRNGMKEVDGKLLITVVAFEKEKNRVSLRSSKPLLRAYQNSPAIPPAWSQPSKHQCPPLA
ncbi:MAG: hypothetical protein H6668_11770 [Ardenticatenaceae bacterium]|nr:hypothetical protein [Ardenticatenaceae bacterium]